MNPLQAEYIGSKVDVSGVQGTIVDETKHMLMVKDTKGDIKKFMKNAHTFIITIDNKKHEIKGKEIMMRPEERIMVKGWKK
ncbi:ribonuclease P protein subunit [Candidatus Woesearchaeota archaeon]|nr:ribonuclease P protein subunit [Candidatus Woesearchaeota archaeon]